MSRVNLFFETFADKQLPDLKVIRLKVLVQFRTEDGWSKPYVAIIDTGAYTSVIPRSIWSSILKIKVTESRIFGFSNKEECSIPGTLAKISSVFLDRLDNQTKPLQHYAMLVETDQIPLIIGFQGVLEKLQVHFNYSINLAYVEQN